MLVGFLVAFTAKKPLSLNQQDDQRSSARTLVAGTGGEIIQNCIKNKIRLITKGPVTIVVGLFYLMEMQSGSSVAMLVISRIDFTKENE